jgi:hypothetical protein
MYGIRSLQNGGPPIPRPRPEERARESLADYKQTPIQQRFLSPQDAETQTLIDSLLAEQQRGPEETELDMIIKQQNEKFSDPLAVLGYQSGNIYGMPTELPGVVDPLGMTELKPEILRKLIEENPSLSPKQFIPPSNELSAYAEIGYKVNRDRTTGEKWLTKSSGITPDGLNTILHELRHIALQNPGMKALLDENKIKEEPFVRVLDYLRATEIGDELKAERVEEFLTSEYGVTPRTFYTRHKSVFDAVEQAANQSLDYMKHLREQSEDNSGE